MVVIICPLVGKGFTDLPKFLGVGGRTICPPVPTVLCQNHVCTYLIPMYIVCMRIRVRIMTVLGFQANKIEFNQLFLSKKSEFLTFGI